MVSGAYAGDVSPREAWDLLATEANAVLVDVRTQPEWSFVGQPDLTRLGKRAVPLSWQVYPGMQVDAAFAAQKLPYFVDPGVTMTPAGARPFIHAYYIEKERICETESEHPRVLYVWRLDSFGERIFAGKISVDGREQSVSGRGNGLISSVVATINEGFGLTLDIADYAEHAIGSGSNVRAAAYVECKTGDGRTVWGVGMDPDIVTASLKAVTCAANRAVAA